MMNYAELEKICLSVIDIVKPVAKDISEKRKAFSAVVIEKKGVRDFVTEVDTNAEKALVIELRKLLPLAGFITEEKTVIQDDTQYKWIIDPLDGTMNYLHGIPAYSISVGLLFEDEIVLGVVYEIVHDEMFFSWKGAPSFCNNEIIKVSGCTVIQDALIATGFPYIRTNERTRKIADTLKYFLDCGRDIRRIGTAATDLCYIACGRMDVYYEGFLNIWDIAGGIIIVQNAGGFVSDFSGQPNFTKGQIVACSPDIKNDVLKGVALMP